MWRRRAISIFIREKIVVPSVPKDYLTTLPGPARQSLLRKKEQINLDEDLARQAIQAYYASITFADAQVGRVLDELDRLGLAKNTVVVFTSDHGYHMGEHGYYQKTTLFENATHVPLIIAAPGMKAAGQATKSLAEMIDFYPTLGELCGLPTPENLAGVSLAPVLDDATAAPRDAALTQYANGYSLRSGRYRYTEWGPQGRFGAELYDHNSDPHELVNLADDAKTAQLRQELRELLHKRIAQAQTPPSGLKRTGAGK